MTDNVKDAHTRLVYASVRLQKASGFLARLKAKRSLKAAKKAYHNAIVEANLEYLSDPVKYLFYTD